MKFLLHTMELKYFIWVAIQFLPFIFSVHYHLAPPASIQAKKQFNYHKLVSKSSRNPKQILRPAPGRPPDPFSPKERISNEVASPLIDFLAEPSVPVSNPVSRSNSDVQSILDEPIDIPEQSKFLFLSSLELYPPSKNLFHHCSVQ